MGKMGYRQRIWVVGVILALAACTSPTYSLLPSPTMTPPPLFSDDFSVAPTQWALFDTESSAAYVEAGQFYLEDRGKGIAAHAPLVNRTYRNVTLQTQVRYIQGTMNNWMGLLCGQQNDETYYLAAISADGYYLVLQVNDGAPVQLVGPEISEKINIGRGVNTLELQCTAQRLSFSINAAPVFTQTITTTIEGGVALFADAVAGGEAALVAFDNFSIQTAAETAPLE